MRKAAWPMYAANKEGNTKAVKAICNTSKESSTTQSSEITLRQKIYKLLTAGIYLFLIEPAMSPVKIDLQILPMASCTIPSLKPLQPQSDLCNGAV